ncbi:MAG: hypothetical protein IJW28_04240 [Clostridia bacterium]|nr:hypothetical protein [Clostridia bacterium]
MSFFCSNRQGCNPGPIVGNPLNGLCEKACIQTKKVFDACMKQLQEPGRTITISNLVPADPSDPLTFVGCSSGGDTTITNLTVDRFNDRPCFARVSGDVNIPVTINYVDSEGVAGTGVGTVTIPSDVVLYVPQPSIVPYTIEATAYAICSNGSYLGNNTFSVDMCVTVIIRVVVDAEMLIPTYGYCKISPCQEYTQDVCSEFFDLPLYPSQQAVSDNACGCGVNNNPNNLNLNM